MRVTVDTNILMSGMLWHGLPRHIFDAARKGTIIFLTSSMLLDELRDVLGRAKFIAVMMRNHTTPDELFTDYHALATRIDPVPPITPTAADPDDDAVLACALAAQADAIVSGDDHLLRLGSYQGIPILTASELLARLASSAQV